MLYAIGDTSSRLPLDRMVPFFTKLVLNFFYHYLVCCFDSFLPITSSIPDYIVVPLKKVKYTFVERTTHISSEKTFSHW